MDELCHLLLHLFPFELLLEQDLNAWQTRGPLGVLLVGLRTGYTEHQKTYLHDKNTRGVFSTVYLIRLYLIFFLLIEGNWFKAQIV